MTIYCTDCKRPLFVDRYGDFTDKPQHCEPSCEELTRQIQHVRLIALAKESTT